MEMFNNLRRGRRNRGDEKEDNKDQGQSEHNSHDASRRDNQPVAESKVLGAYHGTQLAATAPGSSDLPLHDLQGGGSKASAPPASSARELEPHEAHPELWEDPSKAEFEGTIRATVIGAGRMGCAIAGGLALRGAVVKVFDKTEFNCQRAKDVVSSSLGGYVSEGKLTSETAAAAADRVSACYNLKEAVQGDLIVEAVYENAALKEEIFGELDSLAEEGAQYTTFLCSNTINLHLDEISGQVQRLPVCRLRFLHPVYFVDEVEFIMGKHFTVVRLTRLFNMLKILGLHAFDPADVEARLGPKRLSPYEILRRMRENKPGGRGQKEVEPGQDQRQLSQAQAKEDDLSTLCVVCLSGPREILMMPCGHAVTCTACAESIITTRSAPAQCPMCRCLVQDSMLYYT